MILRFKAVANRAYADDTAFDRTFQTINFRLRVDNSGRNEYPPAPPCSFKAVGGEDRTVPFDAVDTAGFNPYPKLLRLRAQSGEQFSACDSKRKSGDIVADGDVPCTAGACIYDRDLASKPCQVCRGGQSRRSSTDDQAVNSH